MSERPNRNDAPPYTAREGLALTLDYLEDPSSVECPTCGPGRVEVLGYVDPIAFAAGTIVPVRPETDYSVLLRCHGCNRAAALHLCWDDPSRTREAA